MKDYYGLLGVAPAATADEVKRAFRQQIARYHPDKVQHLGQEFQALAADRAAELTEAYRILSDEGRRAEYDGARETAAASTPAPSPPARSPTEGAAPASQPVSGAPPSQTPEDHEAPKPHAHGSSFKAERATRDEFVQKAVLERFRQALLSTLSSCDETPVKGFQLACVPKARLFRSKDPRVLARIVPCVDAPAVADAWAQASKWNVPASEEICVFLVGWSLAPARELGDAIAKLRRAPARGAKVTLIPVDGRDWQAHVPNDAPAMVKNLLKRLRAGV